MSRFGHVIAVWIFTQFHLNR